MDPTMGQAVVTGQATFGGWRRVPAAPGMSAYLSVADMQADQASGTEASGVVTGEEAHASVDAGRRSGLAIAAEAPPSPPAVIYPSGRVVDFNKPFQVFDANDDEVIHEDAKIIAVLTGNSYPVVIVSRHDGEQVVSQFDTDGDEMQGELKVENIVTEPVTKYGVLIKQGRGYSLSSDLFASERDAYAGTSVDYNESIALVFPITIPVPGSAPLQRCVGPARGRLGHRDGGERRRQHRAARRAQPSGRQVGERPADQTGRQGPGAQDGRVLRARLHGHQDPR